MKKIKLFYVICLCMIFISIFLSTSMAVEPEFIMKVATSIAKQEWELSYTPDVVFVNEVRTRSLGRIKVEFYGAELGTEKSQLNQVRNGVIQVGGASVGQLVQIYPNLQILSIPYIFKDRLVAWEVLDGPFGQELMEEMAKSTGVRVLSWQENGGFRHFSNNVRPIHSPEDMKGLKIRTMPSPIDMITVKNLGASATPINWSELYTSLETGVVDGQENAIPTFMYPKLEEVQNYIVLDGHVYSIMARYINEKFYQSLPDDLKKVVQDSAKIAQISNKGISVSAEAMGIEYLKKKGVEFYKPNEEEMAKFKEVQKPVIEFLKDKVDTKFIDGILDATANAEKKLGY